MYRQRQTGVTLPELLMVMAVIIMITVAISSIILQAGKINAATSTRIGPQSALMLAMTRMEREVRVAMAVQSSSPRHVQFVLPAKTEQGVNDLDEDEQLIPGLIVRYFQGSKSFPNPNNPSQWNAVPGTAGNPGDILFRAEVEDDTPLDATVPNAQVLLDGLTPTPMVSDPDHPNQEMAANLFEYSVSNPRLITVNLTMPVINPASAPNQHLSLSTQFYLRNIPRSPEG